MTIKDGLAHHRAGRSREAEAAYRAILAAEPENPEALHLLGVLEQQRGHLKPAVELMRRAIALRPKVPTYHRNLGTALQAQGDSPGAEACHRAALALNPDFPEAHHSLAEALRTLGRHPEAETHYRAAIRLKPNFVFAHNGLGLALAAQAKLAEAEAQYRTALTQDPKFAQSMTNLAHVLELQGRRQEAENEFRRALALDPKSLAALVNLGNLLKETGRTTEAARLYTQAIALNPGLAAAHNNLANLYKDSGRAEQALAHFRHALSLEAGFEAAHTNILLTMHYVPGSTPEEIARAHFEWGQRRPAPDRTHANDRDPARALRVAYVSPDLRRHPVASFIEPILEHHDRTRIEAICYATHMRADKTTARLKSLAHGWRDVVGIDDKTLATRIRDDKIDILVELAGHTANHRLGVCALKPTPVQVNYLGYPDTIGLAAIDYRLTDAVADPPGRTERFHAETLVRLPHCYLCYRPPAEAPEVGPLPARASGHVTFGSFNVLAKVHPALVERWARILDAVPGSHLRLKAQPFRDSGVRDYFRGLFARFGIAADRLDLHDHITDSGAHFALYNQVDIALDTDPYNGATTTCDALWMGVPVVTRAGETHVSRMATTMLSAVGLDETIARTPEEYERIAVDLAKDETRLAALRAGLRRRMATSPLMDAPNFVRALEAAYREMWRNWCAGENAAR